MDTPERKEEIRYREVEDIAKNHNITYEQAYQIYIDMKGALDRKKMENDVATKKEDLLHVDNPNEAPAPVAARTRNAGMVPDSTKRKKKA